MTSSSDRGRSSRVQSFAPDRAAFVLIAFVLTALGLLMIYSASSIDALRSETTGFNAAYYVTRQAIFVAAGTAIAVGLAHLDYHLWAEDAKLIVWLAIVALLVAVLVPSVGQTTYGATRWIKLGGFTLQPSEFAKAPLLIVAAGLVEGFVRDGEDSLLEYGKQALMFLVFPMLLILRQPDKGTVITLCATIVLMMYLAGAPKRILAYLAGVGVLVVLFLAFKDEYARERVFTALDPWRDPYGDGYQIIQGLYAFGSGGIFGVGLGNSRQKYSYLPMAHNDFIFAVIGEELGLVGTIAVLLLFFALVYFGFRIARNAPDLCGRLIAAGCVMMMGIQMLINVCGVLKIIPLSGKPIPFLSYGGSSIISSLMVVGLVASVSRVSENSQVNARDSFTVHEGGVSHGFRVIEGGTSSSVSHLRASRDAQDRMPGGGRVSYNSNGTRRITLGPSASDRLRSRDERRSGRG